MSKISIRQYQDSDSKTLAEIYYNTIHKINIQDYNEEQVEAWAPSAIIDMTDGWADEWLRIRKTRPTYVAVYDKSIAGFAEFIDTGYIDCFYCHHEYIGKGVGKALMGHIKSLAAEKGIKRIWAEVSITAKPFFESQGFVVVKQQTVNCRGVDMVNYVMECLV